MTKVKLTVVESKCRGGYHQKGETFIVEEEKMIDFANKNKMVVLAV